jgi:hypothetical protein
MYSEEPPPTPSAPAVLASYCLLGQPFPWQAATAAQPCSSSSSWASYALTVSIAHEQAMPLLSTKCSRLCLNRELYQLRTLSAQLNVPKVSIYRGSSLAQSLIARVPILLLFFMLRVILVTTAAITSGILVMTASSKKMPFFMASPRQGLATFRHQARTALTMSKSLMVKVAKEGSSQIFGGQHSWTSRKLTLFRY